MELFEKDELEKAASTGRPLADRMRPKRLEEFVGQERLIGPGKLLERVVKEKELPSLILWGPPGSGKTTLARIIAGAVGAEFVEYSAVLSGVKEIREAAKAARDARRAGKKTVLFIDEIHRFNKTQQDAFLHGVEDGTITLIGDTTENPSFEVNAPLLSRCKVIVLEPLSAVSLKAIMGRAAKDVENGLGAQGAVFDEGVMDFLAEVSAGDARGALNCLETACLITHPDKDGTRRITMERAEEAAQKKAILYDKAGEEHYNVISVFIKSMRASDPHAAIYWLARMVEAGEDPLFIARRMVIFASEDVGNADPAAIGVAVAVKDAVHFVGMPEGWIPLAQGATYLAAAPKSNASYAAYLEALEDVKKYGAQAVPLHARNAPTRLMKELGYGKGYEYPHSFKDARVDQQCLPDKLKDRRYYKPTDRGREKEIAERMAKQDAEAGEAEKK
ncbi:MAG: replication-associated recombination protein A [Deltaproteobacteria bacterium]|nr:replication-associated recombination protein A [Deltaproteobacteria bacterium]